MAKKAKKLGRPRKKRKYTRLIPEHIKNQVKEDTKHYRQYDPNGGDLGRGIEAAQSEEVRRASEDSYIFLDECKVLVRNLNDYRLNLRTSQLLNEMEEVRRRLEMLQNVYINMFNEQKFRGLK